MDKILEIKDQHGGDKTKRIQGSANIYISWFL